MRRERVLKVVLVVVGVLFTSGIYPLAMHLLHPQKCEYSDVMLLSLYVTLSIFLLVAVRSPSAYRSLIAFAAWSSLAHAIVMDYFLFAHCPGIYSVHGYQSTFPRLHSTANQSFEFVERSKPSRTASFSASLITSVCPCFVCFAEIFFSNLYFLMHILKYVQRRFVFHSLRLPDSLTRRE
jgi:hypothetical protein